MKNITDIVRAGITIITVLFSFTYFFLAAFVYEVKDPQITICVVGIITGVLGYWLGSSIGSSNKQKTIDEIHAGTKQNQG